MISMRLQAALMGLGKTLPKLKFFEPTKRFLKWMKETYGDRLIYDVGAGCGHVAKALSEFGMKVVAIDINRRDGGEEFLVELSNAEAYNYKEESVVMICRPCHGEFAEEVIFRAAECHARFIMYVGLKKNFKNDLGPHFSSFKPVLKNAGLEGETVLVWERIF